MQLLRFIFVFSFLFASIVCFCQDTITVSYANNFSTGRLQPYTSCIQDKSERVSPNAGKIQPIYESEIPDSIQSSINFAIDLWESILCNKDLISIKICYMPIDSDLDIEADVLYYVDSQSKTCIPYSLLSQNREYFRFKAFANRKCLYRACI